MVPKITIYPRKSRPSTQESLFLWIDAVVASRIVDNSRNHLSKCSQTLVHTIMPLVAYIIDRCALRVIHQNTLGAHKYGIDCVELTFACTKVWLKTYLVCRQRIPRIRRRDSQNRRRSYAQGLLCRFCASEHKLWLIYLHKQVILITFVKGHQPKEGY